MKKDTLLNCIRHDLLLRHVLFVAVFVQNMVEGVVEIHHFPHEPASFTIKRLGEVFLDDNPHERKEILLKIKSERIEIESEISDVVGGGLHA